MENTRIPIYILAGGFYRTNHKKWCTDLYSKRVVNKSYVVKQLVSQLTGAVSPHSLAGPSLTSKLCVQGDTPPTCWSLTAVRTNVRDNFPRPSEKKRLRMRFEKRMETRGGRAIIMRRYLKGRHVLSH